MPPSWFRRASTSIRAPGQGTTPRCCSASRTSRRRSRARAGAPTRSGLAMVAEMVEGVLRPHAGDDRRAALDALRSLVLSVFDRYPVPAALGPPPGAKLRAELERRLRLIGLHPPKRVDGYPRALRGGLFRPDADPRETARQRLSDDPQLPARSRSAISMRNSRSAPDAAGARCTPARARRIRIEAASHCAGPESRSKIRRRICERRKERQTGQRYVEGVTRLSYRDRRRPPAVPGRAAPGPVRRCSRAASRRPASSDDAGGAARQGGDVDLVLLDLNMPGVRRAFPACSASRPIPERAGDDRFRDRGSGGDPPAIEFGASGFLPNRSAPTESRAAIETVLAGGVWSPPDVDLARSEDRVAPTLMRRLATLTPQQVRVLMMLSEGLMNKQIAYELPSRRRPSRRTSRRSCRNSASRAAPRRSSPPRRSAPCSAGRDRVRPRLSSPRSC